MTEDAKGDVRGLVEELAKVLTEKPDQVKVEEFEEEGDIVLELTVAEEDMGRVIGKGGRTAKSLRSILAAVSEKQDRHYELEILE